MSYIKKIFILLLIAVTVNAQVKISALPAWGSSAPGANFIFPMVDTNTNITKKVRYSSLMNGAVTIGTNQSITGNKIWNGLSNMYGGLILPSGSNPTLEGQIQYDEIGGNQLLFHNGSGVDTVADRAYARSVGGGGGGSVTKGWTRKGASIKTYTDVAANHVYIRNAAGDTTDIHTGALFSLFGDMAISTTGHIYFGSTDIGIKDSSGIMKFKNTAGGWQTIAGPGSFVDVTSGQTINGNKTFNGATNMYGSLMLPQNAVPTLEGQIYYDQMTTNKIMFMTGGSIDTLADQAYVRAHVGGGVAGGWKRLGASIKTYTDVPANQVYIRAAAGDTTAIHASALVNIFGDLAISTTGHVYFGSTDVGIKDSSGVMKFKNTAGGWQAMAGPGSFVDLTSGQSIAGQKIFSGQIQSTGTFILPQTIVPTVEGQIYYDQAASNKIIFWTGGGIDTLANQAYVRAHSGGGGGGVTIDLTHFSTFAGNYAGHAVPTSSNNTGFGDHALAVASTGSGANSAFGTNALLGITTGQNNTAVGYNALQAAVSVVYSTAVGSNALYSSTGHYNNAFGYNALFANSTGTSNNAFGTQALVANIGGSNNNAFGYQALYSTTSGGNNTAMGDGAARSTNTGSQNTAIGAQALYNSSGGSDNVAIGYNAGAQYTGPSALTTVNTSVFIGENTSASANGNSNEVVIGYGATGNGSNTVTLGNLSTTAVYMGATLISGGGGGSYNIKEDTTHNAIGVGKYALRVQSTGYYGTALGYHALYYSNATGNTAIGAYALNTTTTGGDNTAIGATALQTMGNATDNTAVGSGALNALTTAPRNTGIGSGALGQMSNSGGYNVALGYNAGFYVTGGGANNPSNSIYIGAQSTSGIASADNEIVIGEAMTGKGSNTVLLGTTNTVATYLKGATIFDQEIDTNIGSDTTLSVVGKNAIHFKPQTSSGWVATLTGAITGQVLFVDNSSGSYTVIVTGGITIPVGKLVVIRYTHGAWYGTN